jgi:hypothetical protein
MYLTGKMGPRVVFMFIIAVMLLGDTSLAFDNAGMWWSFTV